MASFVPWVSLKNFQKISVHICSSKGHGAMGTKCRVPLGSDGCLQSLVGAGLFFRLVRANRLMAKSSTRQDSVGF
jgi:hypothetical protein